jgi:hypothetical protein
MANERNGSATGDGLSPVFREMVPDPLAGLVLQVPDRAEAVLVMGLIVYFAYSRKNSLMNPDSPRLGSV